MRTSGACVLLVLVVFGCETGAPVASFGVPKTNTEIVVNPGPHNAVGFRIAPEEVGLRLSQSRVGAWLSHKTPNDVLITIENQRGLPLWPGHAPNMGDSGLFQGWFRLVPQNPTQSVHIVAIASLGYSDRSRCYCFMNENECKSRGHDFWEKPIVFMESVKPSQSRSLHWDGLYYRDNEALEGCIKQNSAFFSEVVVEFCWVESGEKVYAEIDRLIRSIKNPQCKRAKVSLKPGDEVRLVVR